MGLQHLSRQLMQRCGELGSISDEAGRLTRSFHSPAMQQANALVGDWMLQAGMDVREDAAFNLIGRLSSARLGARTLLLGSHLDTVRDAGKYDGPLGVLVAIAAVEEIRLKRALPFHIEIVGFSDEEGLRYQTTYLGSRAMAGTLTKGDLARIEEKGLARARRDPRSLLGYAEVHIEQGPVLERQSLALGIVSGIAGQSRIKVEFEGVAGHAGTVPMDMRRDALCAAAEFILAVECCGITATVGRIGAHPGATNVIPGRTTLSLDVRDLSDQKRTTVIGQLRECALAISTRRGVRLTWNHLQQSRSVACDPGLSALMRTAAGRQQSSVPELHSGAGHDAAAIAALCPVTVLFVRCKGGISHHPAESVKVGDVAKAIAALRDFILLLSESHG